MGQLYIMVGKSYILVDFFLQIGGTIVHLAGEEKLSHNFALGEKMNNYRVCMQSWVDTHYGRRPNFSCRTGFMMTHGV